MINIEIIALTFQTFGTIFVAYAALRVHHRVLSEHKIDVRVFRTMRREQIVGWLGVNMIVVGYFLTLSGMV